MKFGIVKAIAKAATKSKNTIVKHGPQIMAVAGAACFIGATICAVKETPKAMAKLEEKKALDPDMTTLQKAAVLAPEYKATIVCTAAGIIFTGLSWRFEAKYVATLTAALGGAVKEKDAIIEASKEIVGEEKTKEVVTKAEEIKEEDARMESMIGFTPDDIPYPFLFPNGTKIWMTWAQFKRCNEAAAESAAMNKGLKLSQYFEEFGLEPEQMTAEMFERGWQPDAAQYALCENSKDWYQWGYEVAEYGSEPYEEDHYRHVSGWKIRWINKPEPWDSSKTYY